MRWKNLFEYKRPKYLTSLCSTSSSPWRITRQHLMYEELGLFDVYKEWWRQVILLFPNVCLCCRYKSWVKTGFVRVITFANKVVWKVLKIRVMHVLYKMWKLNDKKSCLIEKNCKNRCLYSWETPNLTYSTTRVSQGHSTPSDREVEVVDSKYIASELVWKDTSAWLYSPIWVSVSYMSLKVRLLMYISWNMEILLQQGKTKPFLPWVFFYISFWVPTQCDITHT